MWRMQVEIAAPYSPIPVLRQNGWNNQNPSALSVCVVVVSERKAQFAKKNHVRKKKTKYDTTISC
jgi:hypothetical protein